MIYPGTLVSVSLREAPFLLYEVPVSQTPVITNACLLQPYGSLAIVIAIHKDESAFFTDKFWLLLFQTGQLGWTKDIGYTNIVRT